MAPRKERRNTPKLPLALNPRKSKDVLAVLAERNQPVVPVGAWVEPASPPRSGSTAYVSVSVNPNTKYWGSYPIFPFFFFFASLVLKQSEDAISLRS